MTDTVDRISPAVPVGMTTNAAAKPIAAASDPQRPVAPDAEVQTAPEQITLDVQRGEDGVFVYTLTDPSTGRLVAVIPDGSDARTAGNYASGGWVSLTV